MLKYVRCWHDASRQASAMQKERKLYRIKLCRCRRINAILHKTFRSILSMSGSFPPSPSSGPVFSGLSRAGSGILTLEGILLLILGIGALLVPVLAGIFTAGMIGWLLFIIGVMGLISTLASRPHLHLAGGLLSSLAAILVGLVVVLFPAGMAVALSWLIAAWLMMDGVSSIMIATTARQINAGRWWWLVISGIVDWVLALMIAFSSATTGIALVGTLIGIDLLIGGVAMLGLAHNLRAGTR
ncbi:HdeD protein [Granulibacter bethesdensis]|nr:HdeD protein [Granulibacter bethesdensis]